MRCGNVPDAGIGRKVSRLSGHTPEGLEAGIWGSLSPHPFIQHGVGQAAP